MAERVIIVCGSTAPPLTDELLDKYETLAAIADTSIKHAIHKCLACVFKWWNLPESNKQTLDPEIATILEEYIPWAHEIDAIQQLFNNIPSNQMDLRDAAFHLLWYVRELDFGREPITTDKLYD